MATSDRALDFFGRRANIVGLSAALVGMGGTALLAAGAGLTGLASLIPVGVGVLGYGAGFFLSDSTSADLHVGEANEKVEVATIQRNLRELEKQIEPYRKKLPGEVVAKVDAIIATFREMLPQWSQLSSFGEQKYTVNAILTDYLPNTLQNYLNLPVSYYHSSAKRQTGTEVESQLDILTKAVDEIRDSVYAGVERNIKQQTFFLQSRFVDSDLKLLKGLTTE